MQCWIHTYIIWDINPHLDNAQILTLLWQLLFYLVCQVWRVEEDFTNDVWCPVLTWAWTLKNVLIFSSFTNDSRTFFTHTTTTRSLCSFYFSIYSLYDRPQLKVLTFHPHCVIETDNVSGNQHDLGSWNSNAVTITCFPLHICKILILDEVSIHFPFHIYMDVNVEARKSVALYFTHLLLTQISDMMQLVLNVRLDSKPISIWYRSIFFYQITFVSDIGMTDRVDIWARIESM